MGNPLPPPTVLTALAIGPNLESSVRVIPPSDSPIAGTTYTLVLDDDGLWKRTTNSSAVTVTVPPHSAVPIPLNSSILISQGGSGAVTVAAGAGVTLNASGGTLATTSEFEVIRLFQNTLDNWTLTITGTGGGGGGSSLSITDGTHTVAGTTSLTITGATVGGTTPNATLLIATTGNVVAISGDVAISSANAATYNGMTLVFAAAHTVTLDVGLPSNFGFAAQPPASGNASIASDGTVLLNGATTTVTRALSGNVLFGVAAVGTDSYAVTGS